LALSRSLKREKERKRERKKEREKREFVYIIADKVDDGEVTHDYTFGSWVCMSRAYG